MWRNYVTVGLRALAKNKVYAFINIFGLSIGIAACLLILTYVRYEFSYDSWLPGADRAFQLQDFYKPTKAGGEEMKLQSSSFVSGTAMRKDFPQIERVVYYYTGRVAVMRDGQPVSPGPAAMVDGPIFDILQLPFARGDPKHALDDPHGVVLSETMAKAQFGNADPIGRTITLISGGATTDYRVTGVFRDLPKNTHLEAEIALIARFDPQSFFAANPGVLTSWNNQNGYIYAKLKPGADPRAIEAQFPAWEKRNIPDDVTDGQHTNPGDEQDFKLVNVRDIHLGEAQDGPNGSGDKGTVLTFAVVALLILGMACVNFTNLATARASQRAREVALRKVLGATRRQLIVQFIGESMLLSMIATVIGLALTELALPVLNGFLDAQMQINYLGAHGILLPVLALVLLVGLAGGVYPAFYLSRFQPARVLKANKSAADAEGNGRLRNLLVVAQFAVSIGLIVCTAVIYTQTIYARTADAGYEREGLLQIENMSAPQAEAVGQALAEQVRRISGVTAAARTSIAVIAGSNSATSFKRPGQEPIQLGIYAIEPDMLPAMGMRLLAGRNLSETNGMDDATTPSSSTQVNFKEDRALVARGLNVMLSESAARRLGFASPQAAIGQQVQGAMVDSTLGFLPTTVVGVVSDVRYRTVRDPLQPIFYYYQKTGFRQMMVRFRGDPKAINTQVETLWKQLVPTIPYRARFVEDIVRNAYKRDEKSAQLFGAFAVLAVVIGCLGLFGLAAFTAERRTKEIGIRKVLGARTRDIVRLLVWQFSRPVLIANLIAWPIAWWVMRGWLNQFDMRISLGPIPFVIAGGLALAIAIATISTHAWRVARTNPVYALRYE
jgi:putative ABC transport system permease protein